MFSVMSVHRSQVTWDLRPLPPIFSGLPLCLGSPDLFKLVHVESLTPDLFKLVHLGIPLNLFKHVYYLSHTSIGKRAFCLRLKDFLVNFKVHLDLLILQINYTWTFFGKKDFFNTYPSARSAVRSVIASRPSMMGPRMKSCTSSHSSLSLSSSNNSFD